MGEVSLAACLSRVHESVEGVSSEPVLLWGPPSVCGTPDPNPGGNPSRAGGFPGANSPGPVADLYGPSSQESAVGNYISAASPQPGSGFGPSITESDLASDPASLIRSIRDDSKEGFEVFGCAFSVARYGPADCVCGCTPPPPSRLRCDADGGSLGLGFTLSNRPTGSRRRSLGAVLRRAEGLWNSGATPAAAQCAETEARDYKNRDTPV
ncbi:unnamed protein product [Boreogadus saida]